MSGFGVRPVAGCAAAVASAIWLSMAPAAAGRPAPEPADRPAAVELSDTELREAVADAARGRAVSDELTVVGGDSVVVEVLFADRGGAAAREAIRSAGGDPGQAVPGELIQSEVPLDSLAELEADPRVLFVRAPLDYSEPAEAEVKLELDPARAGAFAGEQIAKTGADVWHAAGITGQGVKVGIIDGFNLPDYNAGVAAGEFPAVQGTFCLNNGVACNIWGGGTGHGLGVAEAVADMAPSAQLYLADVTTAGDAQAAVNYFAANGVRVVTRSQTGRYDGPGNGTGPIAAVIDSAVAQGMTYFNSAGNGAGRNGALGSYWRGTFSDPDMDGWLNFSGGDEYLYWTCSFQNGLRWNDWGEGAQSTDYDLYVYNSAFTQTDSSLDVQGGGGSAPPLELATGCTTADSYIRIFRFATNGGDTNDTLEFMTNGAQVEYFSNPHSAGGPMSDTSNPGALSIGAVDPALGITVARYSSEGPTNDGRIKPDMSAAACLRSLTYSPACFNGTSSSTPVAAGAAALILSGDGATTPAEVKSFLLDRSTVDRGIPGPDNLYGRGELLLPPTGALDRVPPVVQALASKGKQGRMATLRYTASDNSGLSQETIAVLRRGRTLATLQSELGDSTGGTYAVRWGVPRRVKGILSFCVTAADPNGNASAQSCARLKIKKKKKRRRR